LTRVDEIVLSLYAKGITTGEIAAHFAELYDTKISQDTIRSNDQYLWMRPEEAA